MEVGIDIEMCERFKNFDDKNHKVFTQNEVEYAHMRTNPHIHLAGFFCAKESVAKALKVGFGAKIWASDIEVLHNNNGAPQINLSNKKLSDLLDGRKIKISISHTNLIATAVCIIE